MPGRRFCGECGQPNATGPLSFPALLRVFLAGITDVDRGFVFTLSRMSMRPARAIDEYLAGRTIPYTSPQKYLLIAGAITTILLLMLGSQAELTDAAGAGLTAQASPRTAQAIELLVHLIWNHYNLLILASVPFVTAASWLLFRRARRSFAEHLVFNTYTFAHQSLLFTALTLVLWAVASTAALQAVSILLITAYWIWAAIGFFRVRWWSGLLRGLGATLLATAAYMIVLIAATVLRTGSPTPSG